MKQSSALADGTLQASSAYEVLSDEVERKAYAIGQVDHWTLLSRRVFLFEDAGRTIFLGGGGEIMRNL